MTKEDTLSLLKSNILLLRNKREALRKDSKLMRKWNEEREKVQDSIQKLSPEDLKWMNDQYMEWFKSEMMPILPTIINSI